MESSAEGSLYENSSMLTDFNASSRWSDKETKLLIELFKTNFEKLNDKKYKSKSIYAEISKHFSRFTTEQVESKIKNLKKSYKSILDNNSKTGRGKITWPYFTSMNEIFGRDPENSPMSIASNTLGFIKSPDSQDTSDSENISETPKKKR
ncbi:uncharacterized protein LOC115877420 [Sitophilus oryzae]|uniref:Uncharacterized protein LOC115877420 n=1 Tax=Sitophilus oryzae TaxID=7048 RepID=A0A6J2XDM5_SITOR|nr:uncharacterized protein LOC115877420 [Sitophilus oryzae]